VMMMTGEKDQSNKLSPLEAAINENLQRVYREALDETVPDRFQALLDQLRQKGERQVSGAGPTPPIRAMSCRSIFRRCAPSPSA